MLTAITPCLAVALVLAAAPTASPQTSPPDPASGNASPEAPPPAVRAAPPAAEAEPPLALREIAPASARATPEPDGPRPATIRFNLKGATIDQVIDFFSRATGLPVVKETDVPEGTVDYLAPEAYPVPEALRILNIILQSRGVMLRVDDQMLYLQKLSEMQRENIPSFIGALPAEVTDEQIVTVVRPLDIALAKPLAERLSTMVASYGSVAAMEQQNALVLTETAGQVRRLLGIIDELDREDPEGVIEIFKIKHARAADLMQPLNALLARRVEKYVVDAKGKQVKVEDQEVPGLSITFDERTNSIIGKGVQSRIDNLRQAIELLDVPATDGGRSMRTVTLASLSPAEAARRLETLYAGMPEERRPTVLALEDVGKITIVGSDIAITEGLQVLRELDGLDDAMSQGGRRMAVITLEHAEPAGIIAALQSLLNGRQLVATKLVAGPDGASIVVGGSSGDVAAVEQVIGVLDRPGPLDREVRLMRLQADDPATLLRRATELYDTETIDEPAMGVTTRLDETDGLLTVIGSAAAQRRFAEVLRMVEANVVFDRETRQLGVANAAPSAMASALERLSRQLLQPTDGRPYRAPEINAVDELDLLVVTATAEQFAVIEPLVGTLDRRDPSDYGFRVIPLAGIEDLDALLARARTAFDLLARGYEQGEMPEPTVEVDRLAGSLIVSGRSPAVGLFEQAVGEARRLLPPARTGRMYTLRQARAQDVRDGLEELLATSAPAEPSRQVASPTIEVIERTNSLYVIAEPAQHEMLERYVRELDTFEPTDVPPMRLLQVRAADAVELAGLLRQRYAQRPAEQRREQPVDVSADAATNTLIVMSHEDVFAEIRQFVDEVNRMGDTTAERETMIFPLRRARAVDLAQALDKLYPQPPMPLDRRGRPMPHLQEPKEVHVSADAATNTLIVEAPVERRASFEALVEQLDRVELPPRAELRTYAIERGDPQRIAQTLNDLARQGVLSKPADDGGKPVEVIVQFEPESRTLIVAGDEVTFTKTEQILDDLQAVPVPRRLQVFEVAGVDPRELADRALRLYADQTADVPGAGTVTVEVDRENAALLAVADDEALIEFASILNQLREAIGPAPDVRLIPLQYADAAEVVTFLDEMVEADGTMLTPRTGAPPVFQAIERTNSLLVAAQPEQHEMIQSLVRSLDVVQDQQMPPLRILQLRTADAENLAGALMREYGRRPVEERNTKPVSITADPNTNALIVAAHPDMLPEIEGIVRELNDTTRLDSEGREIRIFPLKVARAEELARTIDEMFPEPPMPLDRRGRPMPHLRQPREVVVRADAQTNALIVDAPTARLAGFEELVEQLDRQQISDDTEIRTYPVVHADLDAVAGTLRELASAGTLSISREDRRIPVTITTDPISRTLIVAGPADIFERVEQVLGEIDLRRAGPATTLRFFKLEYARAEALADMLRQVLLTRLVEAVPEAGADVQTLLNVSADPKSNTLIISAPGAVMPLAEQLVDQLDDANVQLGEPVVRVRPLTFADAREVGTALSTAVAAMTSAVTGEPMAVRLIPATGANALILAGLAADLDAVEQLIEPLDARPASDAIDARTFTLEHAEAVVIAPVVERLLTDQQATDPRLIMERIRRSRGQVDLVPPIRVEADARTNDLIVSGPQRTVALAETLITQLDRPDERASVSYELFTPANADPRQLADTARRLVDSARPGGRRGTLELIAEPQSGAVLVVGRAEERQQALAMLERLDAQTLVPPAMDVRLIDVRHGDAAAIAQTLRPLLNDRTRWPESLQTLDRAGVRLAQPTLAAEPGANRLLASGPAELVPMIADLVAELDQPAGDRAADLRIFTLRRAEAADVATAVDAAMAARRRTEPGMPPVTVTAEPSSNALIVTAGAAQLEQIEQIVASLDDSVGGDRAQVRTVFLKHARAENVAPLVEQLLAGEPVPLWMRFEASRRRQEIPDPGPDVRVAADTRLNAIVVSGPAGTLDVAEQMVAQLDVDPEAVGGSVRRPVRVIVIENADAAELAASVEALFAEGDLGETPPTVRVEPTSNSLIVRATETQFRTIEQIVGQVDAATIAASRQMQLVPIDPSRASAAEVAATLRRLLDRGGAPQVEVVELEDLLRRPRREPPPVPDDASSSAGTAGAAGAVGWVGGGAGVRAAGPTLSRALARLAIAVQDPEPASDAASEDDATAEAGPGAPLTIAVDPATNSLVIVGAPRALERVAALARQIEQQIPAAPGIARYIALPEEIDAEQTAQLVQRALAQMTPAGGAAGDYRSRVTVLPDPAANAVLVVANDTDFRTVGELIGVLARPTAADRTIVKIYPLETITVERAASSVEGLLGDDAGRRGRRGRQAQRMRSLAVTLMAGEEPVEALLTPERIRVVGDPQTNALMVMAPAEAIGFLDRFIELIDQTPVNVQTTLKVYPLQHAEADDLRETLRGIFRARYRSLSRQPGATVIEPEFQADDRTNTLLVTGAPETLAEVDTLLVSLDRPLGDDRHPLELIELAAAQPGEAARLLEQVVIGGDQERRASTLIVPDDNSGILLVRASDEVRAEIAAVLAEIDRDATRQFDVRTITLERADAAAVADALQRFFDDRAKIASSGRGRREQGRRVSIVGDPSSKTLLVAASDEDYAQIEQLVEQFDTPQAAGALSFRVFPLQHADADDLEQTVQELVNDLTWNQGPFFFFGPFRGGRGGSMTEGGRVAVRADDRLNALVVTGDGDKFELVESLIDVLDAPQPGDRRRIVRVYPIRNADAELVAEVVEEVFADGASRRRWWEPPDPDQVSVRLDDRSGALIVAASDQEHAEIAELIAGIDAEVASEDQRIEVMAIDYGRADELAETLRRFLADRARALGAPSPSATIAASASANSLVVSAAEGDMDTIRDLLGRLDQPDVSGDRVTEIIALQQGEADEIARIVRDQLGRRRGGGGESVNVSYDSRTNSLIVSAPREQFAQAKALIERLDAPSASDETIIRTYALDAARADEVVRILSDTLQLDERGQTEGITIRLDDSDAPAVEVRARIVADRRSNSLIVTATEESFPVIETLIAKVDEIPAAIEQEWRIIALEHAKADEVYFTLREFLRRARGADEPEARVDYNKSENQLIIAATPDQFEQIGQIIDQLDVPSVRQRVTEFVPLEFAEAEKVREALSFFYGEFAPGAETPAAEAVDIVADPATNSLVISAAESEWAAIRALLGELDSEEYDAALQLKVIPLMYADAASVARAINEAFQGTIERSQRGGRDRGARPRPGGARDDERRDAETPTVLVESEEWVRASAEPQTNSVILSASRPNIRKIETIVSQLDVADYAQLPPPQVIRVTSGDPTQMAASLQQLYEQSGGERGRRSVRIVGDRVSSSIIVRAEEEDFRQIRALATALEQESAEQGLTVSVIPLQSAPARRVADALNGAYQARARQASQPLSIQVDVTGNSLVVASTAAILEEIRGTIDQLDRLAPAAGQAIFIIELENVPPQSAIEVIESIGLDRPARDDSASRLVSEPITVSRLAGRNALIVVANPVDRQTIIDLLKAVDRAPEMGEAQMRVVHLRRAEAEAVARILNGVLDPADQQSQTALARAIEEQVRRLSVRRDGLDEPDLQLDLTVPIRIIPDAPTNTVVISSTPENVRALEQIVRLFDALPVTDAVVVQIFPLENIAADQFARIVEDLFDQGKQLGGVPGSPVSGVPAGTVGRALLDEIALSIDERTNTVVVAGKEDSVALVEVLSQRLDSGIAAGWVEPRVVPLRFADAETLADLLEEVLVEGSRDLPQSTPMQRQIARLRMARADENGGQVLESDVFQPMSRLLIRAEPQLNAIVMVGTPMNLELVTELVRMFDVEAASPSAVVRIYPIEHASASRLASTVTSLFDQQVDSKAIRPEDRVIVQADERTNALIVTTSQRSFMVLERLLEMLDSEVAPDLREIRMIDLEHASATRLARLIQQMMDARLERLRTVQPETADLEQATIEADARTNRLVVAAGNESFEVIRRLAEDLDRSSLGEQSLVEVISVSSASIDRLAETIDRIMERRYADVPEDVRQSQRPLVLTDPRTSSLLVAANPEDLESIRGLVTQLEAAPINPAVALHVVPLDTANAETVAPTLERLMRERQQTLGEAETPADRVTIEADVASNSLIVAASEENLQVVMGLLEALGRAGADALGGASVEVIQLARVDAGDTVNVLEEIYVDEENRKRGANTIRVTADERLNALLVSAPPSDLEVIRGLVADLDNAQPATVVEIKYIPLTSANSLETVSLIENVLSGRGIGSRRTSRQATVLKYMRELVGDDDEADGGEQTQLSAAIRESIILTPDVRTNTVIVTAPRESMAMIEQMIRDLDESSVGLQSIRIFKLVNADATAMAAILTELFNLTRQGNLYVLKPREALPTGGPAPGPGAAPVDQGLFSVGGPELTAVPDERQQLSITVDSRTNSLIVSGTPTYLDLVEDVVLELDAQEANERSVFTYQLRNADAVDVARVIRDFIETEQQKLVSTLGVDQIGSAARLLEREVTIVDDSATNSVLVSVSPRYEDRIRRIIEELDVDPPQVLIQVLLAEVTLDDDYDFGVDLQFEAGVGSATATGGYGLASAFISGMGVPNVAISSTDFQLLIRALQAQGRVQVLSNPSVMAANNEPARIQVGQTIRVPESISFEAGSQQSSVIEEETGIILSVTPTINPDGFVKMIVTPEISQLSEETTQISEDFAAPIITRRNANTTVTVRDGQTIVIGGLISDRYEHRERMVPFFGELPLVGPLFRNESRSAVKTELLIVLTPYVIESPAEIDLLTDREVERLSLPDELKEQIRRSMLEGRLFDAEGNPIGEREGR